MLRRINSRDAQSAQFHARLSQVAVSANLMSCSGWPTYDRFAEANCPIGDRVS
jgi:hypothetical protein